MRPFLTNRTIAPTPFRKRATGQLRAKKQAFKKRNGRRAKNWLKAWRFLKPRLEAAGRIHCEFSFIPHECGLGLTPAHSKKRRMMEGDDIYSVALACLNAHRILDEQMSHSEMYEAVMRAINENGGLILPANY